MKLSMSHYDKKEKRALFAYVFIFFFLAIVIAGGGYLSYRSMDISEFHIPISIRLWQTFGIAGMSIILVGAGLALAWRQQRVLFYRAQAEAAIALRESEERFRVVFEAANDAIHIANVNDQILEVNSRLCEMLGYSRAELLKMCVVDLQAPECRQTGRVVQDETEHYRSSMFKGLVMHRDGRRIPVEISVARIERPQGDFFVSIVRDITERKQAEERLEQFFSINLDLLCIADLEGNFIKVNKAWESILGYSAVELEHRKFLEFVHPKDMDLTLETMSTLGEQKQVLNFVNRYRCHDGSYRFIEWRSQPFGNLIYAAARDITERKQVEESLRESEKRYRRLFDNAILGIFQSTPEGNAISVNDAFAHMFGYDSPEDAVTSIKNVGADIFVDPNRRAEIIRLMAENPGLKTFENLYRRKDGSTFFGSLNMMPIMDHDGSLIRIEGIIEDITERKRAENALKLRESYLTAIIENQPGLVWLKDVDGRFLAVNSAFALSCGKQAPDEVSGRTDFDVWPRELAEKYRADDEEVIRQKMPLHVEESIFDRGQTKWFETYKTPIFDEIGRVIGTTGFARDITERKQAEQALRDSQQLLQAVMDNIPQCIFWKDSQLNYLGCNRAFAANVGLASPSDIVGKTDWDLPSKHAERYRADDTFVMKSGIPKLNFEEPQTTPDGATGWLRTSKVPMRNVDGNVYAVLGLYEDITERKQVEEALRTSTFLDSIIEHCPPSSEFRVPRTLTCSTRRVAICFCCR